MSNSRELSELASQLTVQGDLITLPNLQILGSINTSTLDVSGNFSVLGNVTIGNAGTDTFTINSAITYTGTLTGGTGVVNIGSGQIYKDASGNVGVGTATPGSKLDVVFSTGAAAGVSRFINTNATSQTRNISAVNDTGVSVGVSVFGSSAATAGVLTANSANLYTQAPNLAIIIDNPSGFFDIGTGGGFSSKFRIDSAGNAGLGVVPSAWGGYKALQLGESGSIASSNLSDDLLLSSNSFFNGTSELYITNGFASRLSQFNGQFAFFTAPSGVAGNPITFTQAMALDGAAATHLAFATSRASGAFAQLGYGASGAVIGFYGSAGQLVTGGAVADLALRAESNLILAAGGATERFRIDSAGNAGLGVVPSAWGSQKALEFQYGALSAGNALGTELVGNAFYNGTNWIYREAGTAFRYNQSSAGHSWFTASSGAAGSPITFTQAMTLTQGGNLLVGTTVDGGKKLMLGGSADVGFINNANTSTTLFEVGLLGGANDATGFVYNRANSPVVFGTNNTERARITSAGNMLVGAAAQVDAGNRVEITGGQIGHVSNQFNTYPGSGNPYEIINRSGGPLDLYVSGSLRPVRITSAGYFKASNTGAYGGVAGVGDLVSNSSHNFQSDQDNANVIAATSNTGSNASSFNSFLPTSSAGDHYKGFLNNVLQYAVRANGNVQNTNNSYSGISSIRFKTDVVDSPSYIDRFMQVRFVNFRFKEETGYDQHKQFGVIAEELEQVFPGLVDESPDMEQVTRTRTVDVPAVEEVLDEEGNVVTPAQPATTREEEYTESVPTGTFTKSVKYSVLAQMQGKVIQELNDKIVNLEDQLQQVLTRLSNLENK